jgi:hypothetical protein
MTQILSIYADKNLFLIGVNRRNLRHQRAIVLRLIVYTFALSA